MHFSVGNSARKYHTETQVYGTSRFLAFRAMRSQCADRGSMLAVRSVVKVTYAGKIFSRAAVSPGVKDLAMYC